MPYSKFFGKSKEDLVLLATLGNVLTREQALEMSQTELAAFLFKIDQEYEIKKNPNKSKISREKKPLIKEEKNKTASPKKKEKSGVAQSAENATPVTKLSKRELNKQLFMQELATKNNETAPVVVKTIPETKLSIDAGDVSSNKKRTSPKKQPTISIIPEIKPEIIPEIKIEMKSKIVDETKNETPKKTKTTGKAKKITNEDKVNEAPTDTVIDKPGRKPRQLKSQSIIEPQEVKSEEAITLIKPVKKTNKFNPKIEKQALVTEQPEVAAVVEKKSSISSDVSMNDQLPAEIIPEKSAETGIVEQVVLETSNKNANVDMKETKRTISKKTKSNETKLNETKSNEPKSENDMKQPVETADIKTVEMKTVEIKSKTPNVKKPFKKPVTNMNKNSNTSAENKAETLIEAVSQTDNENVGTKSEPPKTEEKSVMPDKETHAHKPAQDSTHEKHHRHINKPASHESTESGSDLPEDGEKKKHEKVIAPPEILEMVEGALEIMPDGYGFLRKNNYLQGPKDIYIPPQYIRRFGLRPGDWITGPGKLQRETDRYQAILYIKEVNGLPPEKMVGRPQFDQLTPIYPDVRFVLETGRNELSTRIIDLVAPIGKGQRGMIVSPPKAGKTILLQKIANAIATNNPEAKLIVLLIDERPEEVTDMQRSINGEVVFSTFDKTPENHVKVVELVLERAMRLVELGQDVVILLDSITRLARAYNLTINPTGRTLSGGLDPGALYGPKRFFGSARNIENGGSLTIIATSLIDTGSRMDEVIFEEFKGTGNMEVYLDRKLSEKRIFPAIDLNRSGTRREELLLSKRELDAVWTIRKAFGQLDTSAVTEMIINLLLKTNNNSHFVSSVNVSLNDKAMFDAMRGTKPGGSGSNSAGGNMNSSGNNYGNSGNYGNNN